ncbi:hypothetical protein FGU71_08820 [Erythrobacter insulae]|uniref:Uncharacterized protein n=1 Tax=Erythrobacter insulae TaxID=2584124 RepID=A0A547PCT3_9SPHN|nr:hypothetical protein [Erythrobacter insulae]TRD11947.1 hypothetical protein FGU71_08820 [Erythrobacter insulae]
MIRSFLRFFRNPGALVCKTPFDFLRSAKKFAFPVPDWVSIFPDTVALRTDRLVGFEDASVKVRAHFLRKLVNENFKSPTCDAILHVADAGRRQTIGGRKNRFDHVRGIAQAIAGKGKANRSQVTVIYADNVRLAANQAGFREGFSAQTGRKIGRRRGQSGGTFGLKSVTAKLTMMPVFTVDPIVTLSRNGVGIRRH